MASWARHLYRAGRVTGDVEATAKGTIHRRLVRRAMWRLVFKVFR